jgi:hypothetical protein
MEDCSDLQLGIFDQLLRKVMENKNFVKLYEPSFSSPAKSTGHDLSAMEDVEEGSCGTLYRNPY